MTSRNARHTALGLAAFVAVACAEPTCSAERCGTAIVGITGDAGTLFPPSSDSQIEYAIGDLVFSKLADVGQQLNTIGDAGFVPKLATSWVWDDPRTIRFVLHPDARWHDGQPVTAHDVVFTFEVYLDSMVGAIAAPRLDRIRDVVAVDAHTVIVKFTTPYAEMLFDAVYHVRILPKHLLDTVPRTELTAHAFGRRPVGSGPYRFMRWRASEFVELAADSTHFAGPPGVQRVIFRFHSDQSTIVPQLIAEELDIVEYLGGPPSIEAARDALPVRVIEYPSLAYVYIGFNTRDPDNLERPHPLFGSRALRRVVSMAIDRRTATQAVYGPYGHVAGGPIARAYAVWSDTLPQIQFDTVDARRELDRLGWIDRDGDGVRERGGRRLAFDLTVPSSSGGRMRLAQIVQEQLRPLGIAMEITPFDFETTFDRARQGQFDAVFGAYGGDPSPASIIEAWTRKGIGSFNYGHYVNPEVERLAERAQNAVTPEEARPLWHQTIATINMDAPAVFLVEPILVAGVHTRFQNVALRSDQWSALFHQWRIPPDQLIRRDRYGPN